MTPLRHQGTIHFRRRGHGGAKEIGVGVAPTVPIGRTLRVAKLLALALHFEEQLRAGNSMTHAEFAKRGQVSRARISQVMNLLNLAPLIQAELLRWPPIVEGRDPVVLHELQSLANEWCWEEQEVLWKNIRAAKSL